ncbi:MAG: hypothetical protein IPL46_07635 [Saprospiraceae bacterium]|nr:hypothetical protein [Saprospiraceae bacterium]
MKFAIIYGALSITLKSLHVGAQTLYTHHFAKELDRCEATFVSPIEGWYKIKLLRHQRDLQMDLALQSEDKGFEMRFSLQPEYTANIPHITCMTTASTLAINDEHASIKMNFFTTEQALQYFHADWAAFVDFIPKPQISDKYYGRLVTIFREGSGIMHEVLLFDFHDDEKDRRIYSLAFRPKARSTN